MQFVFNKPPPDVKPILAEFQSSVEKQLALSDFPLTLNLLTESQFYSRDGVLNFSSTRYRFAVLHLVLNRNVILSFLSKFMFSTGREGSCV